MSKDRGVRGNTVNSVVYLYFAHSSDAEEARKFLRANNAKVVESSVVDVGNGDDVHKVKVTNLRDKALEWVNSLPQAEAQATTLLERTAGLLAIEKGRQQG